jgi:hypothetical protein
MKVRKKERERERETLPTCGEASQSFDKVQHAIFLHDFLTRSISLFALSVLHALPHAKPHRCSPNTSIHSTTRRNRIEISRST